jgi:hypothetical protein
MKCCATTAHQSHQRGLQRGVHPKRIDEHAGVGFGHLPADAPDGQVGANMNIACGLAIHLLPMASALQPERCEHLLGFCAQRDGCDLNGPASHASVAIHAGDAIKRRFGDRLAQAQPEHAVEQNVGRGGREEQAGAGDLRNTCITVIRRGGKRVCECIRFTEFN